MTTASQWGCQLHPAPDEIRHSLEIFIAPGQVTELRALQVNRSQSRTPCTVAGYFDRDHLADMVAAAAELTGEAQGVYFTPNPLHAAVLSVSTTRTGRTPVRRSPQCRCTRQHHIFTWNRDPVHQPGFLH